jgi:DUF2934 family protein
MADTLEDRIRERAYEIWARAGRPDGDAEQHWLQAERQVLSTAMAEPLTPAARAMPRSRAKSFKPKARAVA